MSFTPNLCCEETKSRGTYTRVTINDYYYSGLSHGAGYPGSSVEKNLPAKAGDMGLIPGWGRSPGEGNGNSLLHLYSCLGNPTDRAARWATVNGVAKEPDAT